jgi:hypothetical protein
MARSVTGAGELVAILVQAGVHLDLDARRPAPLPPELRGRPPEAAGPLKRMGSS